MSCTSNGNSNIFVEQPEQYRYGRSHTFSNLTLPVIGHIRKKLLGNKSKNENDTNGKSEISKLLVVVVLLKKIKS